MLWSICYATSCLKSPVYNAEAVSIVKIVTLAYIGKTGRTTCNIRLEGPKRAFKSTNLQSEHLNFSIDTSHIPYFEYIKIINSNCNNLKNSFFFLEGWFTRLLKSPWRKVLNHPHLLRRLPDILFWKYKDN